MNILPSDMDPISAALNATRKTTYTDILQRLVRRYLFKQERQQFEKNDIGKDAPYRTPAGNSRRTDEC